MNISLKSLESITVLSSEILTFFAESYSFSISPLLTNKRIFIILTSIIPNKVSISTESNSGISYFSVLIFPSGDIDFISGLINDDSAERNIGV
jgi:hypothetical protein